jgi:hypothetical protein
VTFRQQVKQSTIFRGCWLIRGFSAPGLKNVMQITANTIGLYEESSSMTRIENGSAALFRDDRRGIRELSLRNAEPWVHGARAF